MHSAVEGLTWKSGREFPVRNQSEMLEATASAYKILMASLRFSNSTQQAEMVAGQPTNTACRTLTLRFDEANGLLGNF